MRIKQELNCFWRIANSVFNKVKAALPPLFKGPGALFSTSDRAKMLKLFVGT